jgi:hypothetical protein
MHPHITQNQHMIEAQINTKTDKKLAQIKYK